MRIASIFLGVFSTTCAAVFGGCGYNGNWDISAGYRHDSLDWSIAGAQGSPNVLSQLDWENIHIVELKSKLVISGWDSIYTRIEGNYGWVVQQDALYRVYAEDNRQDLLAQSMACRGGDRLLGVKGGIGAHCKPTPWPIDVAILVGYSFQQHKLRYRNPMLMVHPSLPTGVCVDNLEVHYRPEWNGGFGAVDTNIHLCKCLDLFFSYELHFASYRGKGSWDYEEVLRDIELPNIPGNDLDFQDPEFYQHRWKDCSTGWGHHLQATMTYHTSQNWYLGLFGTMDFFHNRKGEYCVTHIKSRISPEKLYAVTLPIGTSRLNPIRYRSYSLGIDLQCRF